MIISQLIIYSFFFISILSSLTYAYLIISYEKGWDKLSFQNSGLQNFPKVSVVIACRNEEKNIDRLLVNLTSQSYPKDKYEIIIVDDFSTDSTLRILQNHIARVIVLSSPQPGKKHAIGYGIEKASGDLILTTDADCIVPEKWVEQHVSLHQEKKSFLQLGLVDFISETNFQKILNLEFFSLIGSAAGSVAMEKAILSNAANMSFSKKIFLEAKNSINITIPSGDDVFLLQEIKKQYPDKIAFLKSKDCIVQTHPPKDITEFFNQRIRWASKNKYYTDKDIKYVGIVVFSVNILAFFSFLLFPLNIKYLFISLSILLIKSVVDFSFLSKVADFFNKKSLLKIFPFVQIIYPFYVVIIGFLSFFAKYKWKNRKY